MQCWCVQWPFKFRSDEIIPVLLMHPVLQQNSNKKKCSFINSKTVYSDDVVFAVHLQTTSWLDARVTDIFISTEIRVIWSREIILVSLKQNIKREKRINCGTDDIINTDWMFYYHNHAYQFCPGNNDRFVKTTNTIRFSKKIFYNTQTRKGTRFFMLRIQLVLCHMTNVWILLLCQWFRIWSMEKYLRNTWLSDKISQKLYPKKLFLKNI